MTGKVINMKYLVYLSTKVDSKKIPIVNKGSTIIVIEPEDYTSNEVKAIKAKGYKVLGYISIGTIEKERSWYKTYAKYKLKRLEDWPNEFYADMTKTAWRQFLVKRAKAIKAKGCDGWWCDNLDVYEYNKSSKMFVACKAVLKQIRSIGGYVMVNGGAEWIDTALDKKIKISELINGYTQEEVFSRIINYSGKGKFGKQTSDDSKFYQSLIKRVIKAKVGAFLLEYTRDETIKKKIIDFCKANKASYYISGDVNL